MFISLQKVFFSVILKYSLFFLLIIGIQNSSNKGKVNFLIGETINLPISFIIGTSFIAGSITGSCFSFFNKKEY